MDELSLLELESVAGGAIPIITGGELEGPVRGTRVRCPEDDGPVLGSRDPVRIPVKTV